MIKSLAIIASIFVVGAAQAVIVAQDNAADVVYDNGWQAGDNGGFGFNAWTLNVSTSNTNNAGHFIGGSQFNANNEGPENINTSGEAFGMYANSSNASSAFRTFAVTTLVGNKYRFELDNGWINNGSAVLAGFYSGATAVGGVEFIGGNSLGVYNIKDGATNTNTTIGFTGKGLTYELEITGATTYTSTLKKKDGSGIYVHNGTFGGSIDNFRFYNTNAGNGGNHDAFVNSLEIDAVPEPATMLILGAGAALAARRRRKS